MILKDLDNGAPVSSAKSKKNNTEIGFGVQLKHVMEKIINKKLTLELSN